MEDLALPSVRSKGMEKSNLPRFDEWVPDEDRPQKHIPKLLVVVASERVEGAGAGAASIQPGRSE